MWRNASWTPMISSGKEEVIICNHHDPEKQIKVKVSKLYEFDGLNKVEVKEAGIGSIVAISATACSAN